MGVLPESQRQRSDVVPACDGLRINDCAELREIELRYVLTMPLFNQGPASIGALVDVLIRHGFRVGGRASKTVSDALRWEMGYDRLPRLGRGRYGPGWMPRGTEHRIHKRALALRDQAARLSLKAGHNDTGLSLGNQTVAAGEAPS
jgi:hypothetical protein